MIGITAHESLVDDGVGVAVRHHLTNVAYAKAVRKAGGIPVLLPMVDPADAALVASRVDAVTPCYSSRRSLACSRARACL